MLVRQAVLEDVAAVVRLEADCLGPDAWSEGLVREGIAGTLPTVHYLVAERGPDLVGHAVASMAGDIAELQRVAVARAHRRSGVATALLAAVVTAARGTEADRLLLEVRVDNRGALQFYSRRGFVEVARRRAYYTDGTTAAVLLLPLGDPLTDLGPGPGHLAPPVL